MTADARTNLYVIGRYDGESFLLVDDGGRPEKPEKVEILSEERWMEAPEIPWGEGVVREETKRHVWRFGFGNARVWLGGRLTVRCLYTEGWQHPKACAVSEQWVKAHDVLGRRIPPGVEAGDLYVCEDAIPFQVMQIAGDRSHAILKNEGWLKAVTWGEGGLSFEWDGDQYEVEPTGLRFLPVRECLIEKAGGSPVAVMIPAAACSTWNKS